MQLLKTKKFLTIATAILSLPLPVFATTTIPWSASSTASTFIQPNTWQGNNVGLYIPKYAGSAKCLQSNIAGFVNPFANDCLLGFTDFNTALGVSACPLVTAGGGGSNLCIGASSGLFLTTGTNNVGIGDSSLFLTSDGGYNTAVGQTTGGGSPHGSNNDSFGYNSLAYNESGDDRKFYSSVGWGDSSSTGSTTKSHDAEFAGFLYADHRDGFGSAFVAIGSTSPIFNFAIASNTPVLAITDNNASLNRKHWILSNNDGVFRIGTSTDISNAATSTKLQIDPSGLVTIPSGLLTLTGVATGCATFTSGALSSTGSACGSGGGSAFPFTTTTFGATTANATGTLMGFTAGLYSLGSTTIGNGNMGLTVFGAATTTGQATFNTGSTALPAIAYSLDVGTGFTFGVGTVNVGFAGVNRMVWNTNKATFPNTIGSNASGGNNITWGTTGFMGFQTNSVQTFQIDSGQNLDIGTTTNTLGLWRLQVASTSPSININDTNAPANTKHFMLSNNDGNFNIGTSSDSMLATSSILRIDNNAQIFLPTVQPATAGTNQAVCVNSTTFQLIRDTTGTCVVSSERFKHDIAKLTVSALDMINRLNVVSFSPNVDDSFDYKDTQYGFIAEQVAAIDPHLAKYGEDGLPRTLDDKAIMGVMAKSIQELSQKVKDLEAIVKKLKK